MVPGRVYLASAVGLVLLGDDLMAAERRLLRNAARCNICDETVESRHRHDYAMCSCENLSVDGGLDYLRRGWIGSWTEMSEWESVCRSGCKTQDHRSYADCLRAASIQLGRLK